MVDLLCTKCTKPLYLVEEALTSFDAEEQMKLSGAKLAKRKAYLDQAAAVLILESFLNLPENRRIPYDRTKYTK